MKKENEEIIRKTVSQGAKADQVLAALRQAMQNEIELMDGQSDDSREQMLAICERMTLPLEMESWTKPVAGTNARGITQETPYSSGKTVVVGIVALVLASACLLLPWGALPAAVVGAVAGWHLSSRRQAQSTNLPPAMPIAEQSEIKVTDTADVIIGKAETALHLLGKTAQPATLARNFKSMLVWLQQMYIEADDFSPEKQAFMKRRVMSVLRQYGYTLEDYNGTNDQYFDLQPSSSIQQNEQVMPAVVVSNESKLEKPGKLAVLGKVFIKKT